jgi:hypothetical protein
VDKFDLGTKWNWRRDGGGEMRVVRVGCRGMRREGRGRRR